MFAIGFEIGLGFASAILAATMAAMLLGAIVNGLGWPAPDDSDRDARHRSELNVHTDAKTGLQYLSTPSGGLFPRLNADGRQMQAGDAP